MKTVLNVTTPQPLEIPECNVPAPLLSETKISDDEIVEVASTSNDGTLTAPCDLIEDQGFSNDQQLLETESPTVVFSFQQCSFELRDSNMKACSRRRQLILRSVSGKVVGGQLLAIMGPSGSGNVNKFVSIECRYQSTLIFTQVRQHY